MKGKIYLYTQRKLKALIDKLQWTINRLMKSIPNFLFIFITALLLQGCVGNSSSAKKNVSKSKSTDTTTTANPTFATDEMLYWFTTSKVTGSLTVNRNTGSVAYLRGKNLHNFLATVDATKVANYQRQYCLIAGYNGHRQLRVRAVPTSLTNGKAIERALRIDLPSLEENESTCGSTTIIDSFNPTSNPADPTVAFAVKNICFNTGCLASTLTSSSLQLYAVASMTQVPTTKISLATVALKIDVQSSSTTPENSCSNSSCSASGFDCCSNGQCVKDATIKSSANTTSNEYAQAMSDYATNPLSFINYPNIFNICSNIAHTPPVVVDPNAPTPLTAAQQRVKDYLADYLCLNTYQTGGGYALCLPGKLVSNYNATKKKLALACGCPSTYSDNDILNKCPDWGVRPLYNSTNEVEANIVDFYCYTPTPESPIGPIVNLNVNVPTRSAPHRFYATDGVSYDNPTKAPLNTVQEGEDFHYDDDVNKMLPINKTYNMNSILGRMNVGLTHTQPAKMVAVELGQTYILSTTSGYFTPCPQCAPDKWFKNFTAHPATAGGTGLQAVGFSTARDLFAGNTSYGNYEDTHFGRACYLPATMIPFSHKKDASLITQRLNRLKTQAALYINGYQKDWFGFNKGALIGSFDGVRWFAIGTGRRVAATSSKLFLAINGSFLDLATRTDMVVNITPDSGVNIVADYDYDPTLNFADIKQNSAASCQRYHQCSTDSDCVTQLGWEYSCAEVAQLRSKWPLYDSTAKELVNQEESASIFEFLKGTTEAGDNTKRCVYRGAGAPCVRNFTTLNGKINQKGLTCAPNFYCAALNTSRFNDELVRSPNEVENILYGMDANVLGRPLKYVTATKSLSADIIANIKNSGGNGALGLTTAETDDMGICRPGKSLDANIATAHANPDSSRRTDYISQVASCDSTASGLSRTSSCPAFGDDLNYVAPTAATATVNLYKQMQNGCGAESKNTVSPFISAFSNIEGGSLQILTSISEPKLVADACYRRAGSVCHTDLDCSPNKMHETATNSLPLSYFGGTDAERNYWTESLVCGQGAATPTMGTAEYSTYKISENRCCREVGKDFTMYTSGPSSLVPGSALTDVNLSTKTFTATNPNAANRYSRYTASKTAQTNTLAIPAVNAGVAPAANQWNVLNETGSLTCCGGGWVRKFADGTHDWRAKKRLEIDTSNFACLNYRSPLVSSDFNDFTLINQVAYQREYENLCKFPSYNGCMQILFNTDITDENQIIPPITYNPSLKENVGEDTGPAITPPSWATSSPYSASNPYTRLPTGTNRTRLDTSPVGDLSNVYTFKHNRDAPYQPFPYYFPQYPYDLYTHTDTGAKEAFAFFIDQKTDYGVSMYLPLYVPVSYTASPRDFDLPNAKIYIKYFYANGKQEVVNITNFKKDDTACLGVINWPNTGVGYPITALNNGIDEAWCVTSNPTTQNRPVMNVKAYTGTDPDRAWSYASIIIDFIPLEKLTPNKPVTKPGSPEYYLSKLAKLELIGIPQITYEPIYCNSNQKLLVPGIFTSSLVSRDDFKNNSFAGYNSATAYTGDSTNVSEAVSGVNEVGNPDYRMTYQDKLGHQAVFSAKDFACCTPLGKESASGAKCCSGTATAGTDGKLICKLPVGTDLNVYFNKFVSNEGVGENLPLGGLITTVTSSTTEDDVDFNKYTGEPKARNKTFQKLLALGNLYCPNGVKNGGVFGNFESEPFSGYLSYEDTNQIEHPISIMDSLKDKTDTQFAFDNGYRWNNHYYCK
jgi:hypothetical protein